MRLPSHEVEYLARKIVRVLMVSGAIEVDSEQVVIDGIARVITENLQAEDRLNEEVREVLLEHSSEMERSNITYTEMFKMVKKRLAKEKGVIL